MKTDVSFSDHPLNKKSFSHIKTWNDWLNTWEKASTLPECLGLLHYGFSQAIHVPNQSQRAIFYLKVADGWMRAESFKSEERFDSDTESVKELAEKAFSVLCRAHFKELFTFLDHSNSSSNRHWLRFIVDTGLLEEYIHFFRMGPFRLTNLPMNRSENNSVEISTRFLFLLIEFIWRWKRSIFSDETPEGKNLNDQLEARIKKARLWSVRVIASMEAWNMFDKIWDLEPEHERILISIATEGNIDRNLVIEERPIKNLEEASLVGSRLAKYILNYQRDKETRKRLQEALKAEQDLNRARRRVEKLNKQ